MVGSAVDTIVWSSAESNIPSRTVTNTRFIRRRSMTGWATGGGAVCTVMTTNSDRSRDAALRSGRTLALALRSPSVAARRPPGRQPMRNSRRIGATRSGSPRWSRFWVTAWFVPVTSPTDDPGIVLPRMSTARRR